MLKLKNLAKSKRLNFVKTNSFETDFLTIITKKTFINLQKTFTKALNFYHFNLKSFI